MATTKHALAQLKKAGAKVTKDARIKNRWIGQMPAARIEVNDQDGEAITIYLIKNGEQDELETDYFAGHFCNTIKGAIESARKMETWNTPNKPSPTGRFAGWYEELH